MGIDTYKHKNDYTVCLNQCDMYYIRPYDTLLEEGLEKIEKKVNDNYKELMLMIKQTEISEYEKNEEARQNSYLSSKDFDQAFEELDAALSVETYWPKEDEESEEL